MNEFSLLDGQIKGVRWGSGTPVLAFHGFLENAMSFKLLSHKMDGIEIWAIDLPGHGLSGALPKVDGLFMLNWLPILGRVLDDLNWPEYRVVGHSMGAILSQLLAAVDPRIVALYSFDAFGPVTSPDDDNMSRFQRVYDGRHKIFPTHYYESYEKLIESRCSGLFPLSKEAAQIMAQRGLGYGDKGWYHRYDRRLRGDSLWRLSEEEILTWLSAIPVPIHLLLSSAQNWPGYRGLLDKRLAIANDLSVTTMLGSHHLHIEQPQKAADWLRPLLL